MIIFEKRRNKKSVDKKFFLSIYIFLFFAGIYSGMYCQRFGVLTDLFQHLKSFKLEPSTYIKYALEEDKNSLPVVKIDFKFKDYIKLSNQRSRFVYSSDHFFNGQQWVNREDMYVKSQIKYNGVKYKAKSKLFGLNNDHYRHPYKWSFRIKSKEFIEDFKNLKFNLLQPNTRQYLSDVLCNYVFKEHQILNLEYIPINLKINDRVQDIYFVEDFFSKNLIERNRFRDSFIFTFNKLKHPSLDKMTKKQIVDLELIKKDISMYPNSILDISKFDVFMATIFILQNKHPLLEGNFHMFYNSVTNKVEPIIRETWFEKELRINSEAELKKQLLDFVENMKVYNQPLHTYLNQILENDSRLQNLSDAIISVANTMDQIIATKKWKSFEDTIYTRYPNALFICKNLRKNIETIINLKIKLKLRSVLKNKHLRIKNDTILTSDIFLKNVDLKIASGVKVDLNGYDILINEGNIEAISESKKPIVFLNNTKRKSSIIVKNAKDTSRFKNVIIKNLSNKEDRYWKVPAGLTFYESNVKIENSTFESNMSGDDYINFFRCEYFYIDHTIFKNVVADAIDSDFSNGYITNSSFYNIGNDAIDGSGSTIDIQECIFKNIQDKVISAGEKSEITISNSFISTSEIVFVSKDGATVREKNNELSENKLNYCTFRKKKEFGFGKLYSDKEIKNYSYLIEKKSIIYKNNKLLDNLIKTDSVKEKLYGVNYGRKSVRE